MLSSMNYLGHPLQLCWLASLVICQCALSPAIAQPVVPGTEPARAEGQGLFGPLTSALDRIAVDLTGDWQYIPDPYDTGSLSHLSKPLDRGWWANRERTHPEQRIEYSFAGADRMVVPGDWNSQDERLFFYEGTVWYERSFQFEPEEDSRTFLYFGAVNRHADVWLNGAYLGSHHVGFTPFCFETTGKLAAGKNSIVVRVDNRRRAEDVPAIRTDWWNYGGLTREVAVLQTPATFIRSWEFKLDEAGMRVLGSVQLDGPRAAHTQLKVEIEALDGPRSLTTDGNGRAVFQAEWPQDRDLWSPESPTLQDIVWHSPTDTARDRVGFRTIRTDGTSIMLNGEEVFLRGICLHEEAPDRPGRAWSESDARMLLGWAKELGCNYVRLAHYTHNEHMLRVADELGLMVWAEIPVYWVLDFQNPLTQGYARVHLTEMVERDRNRASVVIWSVGNENEGNQSQTQLRRALASLARTLDPSRLVSAACFVRMTRDDAGRLNGVFVDDPFGEHADVLAINEYIGWYHDSTDQLAGLPIESKWDKPLVLSEFGAGVKAGLRGTANEVWTEEFGARFYRDQLAWCDELKGKGQLQGLSPWILKDFRSPRRPLAGIQDWYNRKGLISEGGERKDVFEILQQHYHAWSHDPKDKPD